MSRPLGVFSNSMGGMLAFGALTLIFGWGVFSGGTTAPRDWRVSLALTGVAAAGYFALARKRPLRLPDRAVRRVSLIMLAWAVAPVLPVPLGVLRILSPARAELVAGAEPVLGKMAFATLGVRPAGSLEILPGLIGCALVFALVVDLGWRLRERPWILVAPLVLIGFLEALLGLVQAYAAGGDRLARGTYVNPSYFAGLLEMCLPFAAIWPFAVLHRSRHVRRPRPARTALVACAGWTVAAVMLLAILLSVSRGAFLATLFSLMVLGLVGLGTGRRRFRHWWLPAGLLTVVFSLALVFLPPDRLIFKIGQKASSEAISTDARTRMWRDAIRLIGVYPLFGCGLNAYESCLMPYQTALPMFTVDYAHNDYLQAAAEQGIAGLWLWLALAALVLRSLWKVITRSSWPEERYRSLACLGSFAAIALHSLVDFNLHIPANAMTLAWIGGIAHCTPENH